MPCGEKRTNGWIKGTQTHLTHPTHASLSPKRHTIRNQFWIPIKERLRAHIKGTPHGEIAIIAKQVKVSSSQIHRYQCPKCEHDAEPVYHVGRAIEHYLDNYQYPILSPSERVSYNQYQTQKTARIEKQANNIIKQILQHYENQRPTTQHPSINRQY